MPSRVIGVDLGLRRVGLAVADEGGVLATPLEVVAFPGLDKLASLLTSIAAREGAGSFVVGYPLNMDGTAGEAAKRAAKFARKLSSESGLPVTLSDERLTTFQAQKEMIALGKSRKDRRAAIDGVAAVLILENHLRREALNGRSKDGDL